MINPNKLSGKSCCVDHHFLALMISQRPHASLDGPSSILRNLSPLEFPSNIAITTLCTTLHHYSFSSTLCMLYPARQVLNLALKCKLLSQILHCFHDEDDSIKYLSSLFHADRPLMESRTCGFLIGVSSTSSTFSGGRLRPKPNGLLSGEHSYSWGASKLLP